MAIVEFGFENHFRKGYTIVASEAECDADCLEDLDSDANCCLSQLGRIVIETGSGYAKICGYICQFPDATDLQQNCCQISWSTARLKSGPKNIL